LRTASQLRAMLVPTVGRGDASDRPVPKRPEVLVTTASTGEGVPELLAALDRHRSTGHDGLTAAARRDRALAQIRGVLADRLSDRLREPALAPLAASLVDEVAEHRLDPYAAADRLLDAIARDGR
jgi:LAO/AO transport system kinase